jgi:hypothetical protein
VSIRMANAAIIWTFAGVLAAACFTRGLNMQDTSHELAGLLWYTPGALFLVGGGLLWISMESEVMIQQRFVLGVVGGIFGALAIISIGEMVRPSGVKAQSAPNQTYKNEATPMATENDLNNVTGTTIIGNNQGGAAAEVLSSGSPRQPSVGMDITASGAPGQNVTGLKVIQNGPGTGLRVIQNGPGVGVRSTVIVGPDNK